MSGLVKAALAPPRGGVSRPGARVRRQLIVAMGDDAERARAPRHDRAALGPTGLTPVKSKRAATEPAAADGAAGAADAGPAPGSADTIVMADSEPAEAIAGGGVAGAAAAAEAPAAAAVVSDSSGQKSPTSDSTEVGPGADGTPFCRGDGWVECECLVALTAH